CFSCLQTKLLTQYILNLSKYDQNYDIRDRTRFIRQLIVPNEKSGTLNKYARRILLAPKPAPVLESAFKDRDRFQLGTLSHSLNTKATGYLELSDWPAVAPDQSVRNVEVIEPVKESALAKTKPSKSHDKFYSDDSGEDEEEKEEEGSESSSSEDSSSSSSEESGSEEDSDEKSSEESEKSSSESAKSSSDSESDQKKKTKKAPQKKSKPSANDSESDENGNGPVAEASSLSAESSSGSETDSEDSDSDSDSHSAQKKSDRKSKTKVEVKSKNEVSLLDLDDFSPASLKAPQSSVLSPSLLSDLEGLSLSDISPTMQVSAHVSV
ncbi:hypothetical protein LDENG_00235160, partial [Lucifuga dentata]